MRQNNICYAPVNDCGGFGIGIQNRYSHQQTEVMDLVFFILVLINNQIYT